jgi:hypothetical protein
MINIRSASTMEMTAVMKIVRWSTGVCVAAVALALNLGVANAQQKAPDAKAPDAVKKVQAAPKKAAAPAAPKCNDLKVEAACGVAPGCQWIAASKTKVGKEIKAYCRTAPKAKAKPAAKAADPAAKAATGKAPATPKAATTKAPAAPKN